MEAKKNKLISEASSYVHRSVVQQALVCLNLSPFQRMKVLNLLRAAYIAGKERQDGRL